MKKVLFVLAIISISLFNLSASDEVMTDGVKAGKWTMDYEAAKAEAAKTGLPIIINFTGSDWCSWCIKMEDQVFSQSEWSNFSKDNVIQVFIDFPQDKSKVPEKYVARNAELRDSFQVRGYPTYVILDGKSGAKLGQLGASQDITAGSFVNQVKEFTRFTDQSLNALVKSLDAETKKAVESEVQALKQSETSLIELEQKYQAEKAALNAKINKAKNAIRKSQEEIRLKSEGYSKEDITRYLGLIEAEAKTQKELEEWIATGPVRNEENTAKYENFQKTLKEIRAELSEF